MSGETFTGFTPAPDCIRDDIDALAALVFGAVWRFGQQAKAGGRCTASIPTIAKRVGIGQTAVRARLTLLVARGWLTAEEHIGRPTTYRDSGRWTLQVIGHDTAEPLREQESTPSFGDGVWLAPLRETNPTPPRDEPPPLRETNPKIVLPREGLRKGSANAVPPTFSSIVLAHMEASIGGASLKEPGGKLKPGIGQMIGLLGSWSADDAAKACRLWDKYAASKDWTFKGHTSSWPIKAGDWYATNGPKVLRVPMDRR